MMRPVVLWGPHEILAMGSFGRLLKLYKGEASSAKASFHPPEKCFLPSSRAMSISAGRGSFLLLLPQHRLASLGSMLQGYRGLLPCVNQECQPQCSGLCLLLRSFLSVKEPKNKGNATQNLLLSSPAKTPNKKQRKRVENLAKLLSELHSSF